jgi:hypothetical protein
MLRNFVRLVDRFRARPAEHCRYPILPEDLEASFATKLGKSQLPFQRRDSLHSRSLVSQILYFGKHTCKKAYRQMCCRCVAANDSTSGATRCPGAKVRYRRGLYVLAQSRAHSMGEQVSRRAADQAPRRVTESANVLRIFVACRKHRETKRWTSL